MQLRYANRIALAVYTLKTRFDQPCGLPHFEFAPTCLGILVISQLESNRSELQASRQLKGCVRKCGRLSIPVTISGELVLTNPILFELCTRG